MGATDWVIKTLQQGDSGASGLKALMCWEAGLPREARKLCTPLPLYFALCISSMWLFLSRILYNKPVNMSVLLSSMSHSSEVLNLRGQQKPPNLQSAGQKCGWPGHSIFHWHLKWGLSCGAEPLTSETCNNSGQLAPELNCIVRHPAGIGELVLEIAIPLVSENTQHLLLGHWGIKQVIRETWELMRAVNVSMLKFQAIRFKE